MASSPRRDAAGAAGAAAADVSTGVDEVAAAPAATTAATAAEAAGAARREAAEFAAGIASLRGYESAVKNLSTLTRHNTFDQARATRRTLPPTSSLSFTEVLAN